MKQISLIKELIGEVFGTFILILLGDGVVANVGLAPRLAGTAYSWDTIAYGWAFAVIVAVYVVGGVSGAHINPAVTLSLAVSRGFPWKKVIPYIIAQVIGAFLGALAVYIVYHDGLVAAGMPNIWATSAGSIFSGPFWGGASGAAGTATKVGTYGLLNACLAELIGTAVLMWGVLASGDSKNLGLLHNLGPFLIGGVVLAIGLSLGGTSGYAINPARDLGPRLLGTLVGTKDLFSGIYWLVAPIISPLIGGVVGTVTYDLFVTRALNQRGQPE